jgi:hypothetical protein
VFHRKGLERYLPVELVVGVDEDELASREVDPVIRQVEQRRVVEVGVRLPVDVLKSNL